MLFDGIDDIKSSLPVRLALLQNMCMGANVSVGEYVHIHASVNVSGKYKIIRGAGRYYQLLFLACCTFPPIFSYSVAAQNELKDRQMKISDIS